MPAFLHGLSVLTFSSHALTPQYLLQNCKTNAQGNSRSQEGLSVGKSWAWQQTGLAPAMTTSRQHQGFQTQRFVMFALQRWSCTLHFQMLLWSVFNCCCQIFFQDTPFPPHLKVFIFLINIKSVVDFRTTVYSDTLHSQREREKGGGGRNCLHNYMVKG